VRAIWLLALLSLRPAAAEPEVTLPVGPGARVEPMPRIKAQVEEIIVRSASGDLGVLRDVSTPAIDQLDAVSRGDGDWFVRMHLVDPDTHLVARVVDGQLQLSIAPGARPARQPLPNTPSIDVLLADAAAETEPDRMPRMAFLHGEAMSDRLTPAEYPLRLGEPGWLAEDRGGWYKLDEARLDYLRAEACGESCATARAEALYALGWRYLEMDWDREGRHYIELLPADRAAVFDPLPVAMSRARAALETENWDAAREQLGHAWSLGAPATDIAEGIALVSLQSGVPARAASGRVLASTTAAPHAQLLSAELLQLDGHYDESIVVLEPLLDIFEQAEDTESLHRAALRLGDAFLVNGKIDEARRAWQRTTEPMRLYRAVYAELYRAGAESWVAAIPMLLEWGQQEDELAAESMYLAAQIDEAMGIDVDAIESYAAFIDQFPDKARRSDVPADLWTLYARRARRLYRDKEWYALAALHESAWREALYDSMEDPTVLWEVAQAYEQLGLNRKALDVLTEGFAKLVAGSETNPGMTLHLADLYERLGNERDGLKTLDFLDSIGTPPERAGEVALMRGRMLLSRGEQAEAIQQLQLARRDPVFRDEADLITARIDAEQGRCARAVGPMEQLLMSDTGQLRWSDPALYLELTRCAVEVGRRPLAAQAALAAADRSTSEEEARYATLLAQLYSDPSQLPERLQDGEDIWARLGQERVASEAFQAQLDRKIE